MAQAAFNLAVLHESSFIGGQDTEQALKWYALADSLGHPDGAQAARRLNGTSDAQNMAEMHKNMADQNIKSAEALAQQHLVAIIQEKLVDHHMLPTGSTNGILDARTSDAIRAYQQQAGMHIDGQASKELLKHMVAQ